MSIFNPIFPILLTLLAILSVAITYLFDRGTPPAVRFPAISGMRGYLAVFVMLHHAAIWFSFVHTGSWVLPSTHLHAHLGQASVILFFMITSFLFYDQLLNSRGREFDWRSFFIGRFFRITPLYLVVLMFVFLTVGFLSHWRMAENPGAVLYSVAKWLMFTIPTAADINGITQTWIIVAGVTWSLRYEWCFYFALPLISIATGQRPALSVLLASIAGLAVGWAIGLDVKYGAIFLGG